MDESAVVSPPMVGRPLRLHPFRGLTLAPRLIGGPAGARAFARPYRDAARRIARWEATGRVTGDSSPAVYLHEYTVDGVTVRGLVGALDLSHPAHTPAERAVLPHEVARPTQVEDLARRMAEMSMNPAPILLVHRGPAEVRALSADLRREAPMRGFLDRARTQHRVWALRDPERLRVMAGALATSTAVIADGHHRHAAYLMLQAQHPGTAWDRGLAMLVDQNDTPLQLGAIHRVLGRVRLADVAAVATRLPGCSWESVDEGRALESIGSGRTGPPAVAVSDGAHWGVLELPVGQHQAIVEVVHEGVLPALPRRPQKVHYEHSVDEALTRVRRQPGVAILLPAPGYDLLHDVLSRGGLLPEKATSFQPKPPFGVLMRSLRDEAASPP